MKNKLTSRNEKLSILNKLFFKWKNKLYVILFYSVFIDILLIIIRII